MTKPKATVEYFTRLKEFDDSPESRAGLARAAEALIGFVHGVIREQRAGEGERGLVGELQNASAFLLERLLSAGSESTAPVGGLSVRDLATQLGLLDTLTTLLRLDPAHTVPETRRRIASDRVKMDILYLVEAAPRTKTELVELELGVEGRALSASSISQHTRALAEEGVTYETRDGPYIRVHLSKQGKRLLDLVRRRVIPGLTEASVALGLPPAPTTSDDPSESQVQKLIADWQPRLALRQAAPTTSAEILATTAPLTWGLAPAPAQESAVGS